MIAFGKRFNVLLFALLFSNSFLAQESTQVPIDGLDKPVEILKDRWGISHIYAQTEHDLFFAQGYSLSLIHI